MQYDIINDIEEYLTFLKLAIHLVNIPSFSGKYCLFQSVIFFASAFQMPLLEQAVNSTQPNCLC